MAKKLMGIRLSENVLKKLERIGHNVNRTPNQVATNAILEWVEIFHVAKHQGMIIIGKPLMTHLLKKLDVKELDPMMEKLVERGADFYHFVLDKYLSPETLDEFIKHAPKVLGPTGLMWFDHIEVSKLNKKVRFKGTHGLGNTWSEFYILMLNNLMKKYFNSKLIEDTKKYTTESIFVEYEQIS